jgi:hypothetical protein
MQYEIEYFLVSRNRIAKTNRSETEKMFVSTGGGRLSHDRIFLGIQKQDCENEKTNRSETEKMFVSTGGRCPPVFPVSYILAQI